MKFSHFLFFILLIPGFSWGQATDPLPPQCAGVAEADASGSLTPICGNTSHP